MVMAARSWPSDGAPGEASRGLAVYFVDREGALKTKQPIDTTGMDTEDLIVGDFNGDKKPDIVASGRATRNVKIYWNETQRRSRKERRRFERRSTRSFSICFACLGFAFILLPFFPATQLSSPAENSRPRSSRYPDR